jgi:hypothetical protein
MTSFPSGMTSFPSGMTSFPSGMTSILSGLISFLPRSSTARGFLASAPKHTGRDRLPCMSTTTFARVTARLALLVVLAACETTEPTDAVALRFDEIPVSTITTAQKPDGSTVESHGGDGELLGRKIVGLQVGVFVPATIESITLTYWAAGNRAGAHSYEKVVNEQYAPAAGPTAVIHKLEIPGADRFQLCQSLYYVFSARYRLSDGTAGTFNGQPRLIQLTKRLLSDGRMEQVSCGPPPGPNE